MNKRAQSIVEYTLVAVLVILGVVYMGPDVLRSIGAHFKLWDYSVQDSVDENLSQAPVNKVPDIPIDCKCQNIPGDCGTGGGEGSCPLGYRANNHICDPQFCDGCHPSATNDCSACVPDPNCCTTYVESGCGTIPCPAGGCATAPTTPLPTPPSTTPLNNCYFGQRIWATYCSDLPVECKYDTTCDPTCQGVVLPGSVYCATNTTTPPTGLDQNIYTTFTCLCPSSPTCQMTCPFGTICAGSCPAGYFMPNSGCPQGYT